MKHLLILTASILPALATANPHNNAVQNTSNTEYNSPMNNANTMSNVQVNNSATPYVDLRGIRCPTAALTAGAGITQADSSKAYADSHNLVIGFQMPIDINGTIDRCVQAQQADLANMRFDNDLKILSVCEKALEKGYYLDPEIFPWAAKCEGVTKKRIQQTAYVQVQQAQQPVQRPATPLNKYTDEQLREREKRMKEMWEDMFAK